MIQRPPVIIFLVSVICVIVLGIILYSAYSDKKLDAYLAVQDRKGGFVGAMAQRASLVPCAFPVSSTWSLNRCNQM